MTGIGIKITGKFSARFFCQYIALNFISANNPFNYMAA
jgi:hypothetical protein